MDIQKIKIVSNNISYGPPPSPTDEVEQHLTISSRGRIWFKGYNYGEDFDNYKIGRSYQLSIGKNKASDILSFISKCFSSHLLNMFVTDVGSWEITITDTNKANHKFKGSLWGGVVVEDINLTEYIRESIPIDGLFVFDDLPWNENRIL